MSAEPAHDDQEETIEQRLSRLESKIEHVESARSFEPVEVAAIRKLLRRIAGYDATDDTDHLDVLDLVTEGHERLNELEHATDAAETAAEMALQTARAVNDGRSPSDGPAKVDLARNISRNELIRATADNRQKYNDVHGTRVEYQIGSVTNREVQEMAKPDADLEWQTVQDAWDELVRTWECFTVDTSKDPKRLTLTAVEDIPRSVAKGVEQDLGRSDLAKLLVGGGSQGGGHE